MFGKGFIILELQILQEVEEFQAGSVMWVAHVCLYHQLQQLVVMEAVAGEAQLFLKLQERQQRDFILLV